MKTANLKIRDFSVGLPVTYIPRYTKLGHIEDYEQGIVSSIGTSYIFVKFKLNGILQETSMACSPESLHIPKIHREYKS